jgi:hypothetical protein
VKLPSEFAHDTATVVQLTANSAHATHGLTLGGVSFGKWTGTGVLPLTKPAIIRPRRSGVIQVQVPPSSAALVTINAPYAPPPAVPLPRPTGPTGPTGASGVTGVTGVTGISGQSILGGGLPLGL